MKLATTLLVFCVTALLALGMVMLYSSSMAQVGPRYLMTQLACCAMGLVACGVGACLDYRWLKKVAWPLLGLAIILLILVLIPGIGKKVHGARRWIVFGGLRFQPSELAKLALIIALAYYGERFQKWMPTFRGGLLGPGAMIVVVLGLIFVEPDRGATILMAAVSTILLLVAGVRWRFVAPPFCLAVAGLVISLWRDPMRFGRVFGWWHLEQNQNGVNYQAWQGMLALGAGGWNGLGLGQGRQKFDFLPEHDTDFIFAVIGEELGVIATVLIVVAFVTLVICGVYIAWNSPDVFGLLLGSGISFLIGMQAFINIGVVTSALPNKGLPLPFISYGGSNLLIMLACVGVLLSIARHGRVGRVALENEELAGPEASPSLTA